MHKALGTQSTGAVRFGFSRFNTPDEIDIGIVTVYEFAQAAANPV